MPINLKIGDIVDFNNHSYHFTAKITSIKFTYGKTYLGKIIRNISGGWRSTDVTFDNSCLQYMTLINPEKIPTQFNITAKNSREMTITLRRATT